MLTINIILTIFIGLLIVELAYHSGSLVEKIGLSFPIGIFVQTVLMVLMDTLNIPLTRTYMMVIPMALWLVLCFFTYKKGHWRKSFSEYKELLMKQLGSVNVVWLLFIIAICYVEYMNFSKCMYFPTFDRDSLAGFETIGYVIAQESTIKGLSIFNTGYNPGIHGAASYISYMPFTQLSYTFVYIFGAETSKIIPAFMFLFFIIAFYGVLSKSIKKTGAAMVTLLMVLTPEMLAFSSMSATNVLQAIFASLGTIYGIRWLNNHEKGDMLISALLLSANIWTRSEGAIFMAALGLFALIIAIRSRKYKQLIIWGLVAFVPFVFYSIYQKVFGLTSEGIIMTSLFWDMEKMDVITKAMFSHLSNRLFYGWTFTAFLISLVLNVWFMVKKRDNLYALFSLLICVLLYMVILYQIDYKWDSINNVLAYSAKRFIFCFVPIAWYYLSTNRVVSIPLVKLEELLTFKRKKD